MGFGKLDRTITKSSVWSEKCHVRVVWVSFIAEKDSEGMVYGSRAGLIRTCNVTEEEYDEAVSVLSSPDPESKNPDHEGRRIEAIPGGWLVLNHEYYRLPEDQKRAATKERVRRFRNKNRVGNADVTEGNTGNTAPVSASVSASDKQNEEAEDKPRGSRFTPPSVAEVQAYCNERHNGIDAQAFVDHYTTVGWVVGKNKPMKDWKGAVRTWENRKRVDDEQQQTFLSPGHRPFVD